MLVNKPQFDTKELRPGTPIRVTASQWNTVNGSYAWSAIVTKSAPLEIEVVRVNDDVEEDDRNFMKGFGNVEVLTIGVDSVAYKTVKIEKLVPAKEGEN